MATALVAPDPNEKPPASEMASAVVVVRFGGCNGGRADVTSLRPALLEKDGVVCGDEFARVTRLGRGRSVSQDSFRELAHGTLGNIAHHACRGTGSEPLAMD